MFDVIGLVLPFFGLILIGFIIGKRVELDVSALGWMNIFIIYVALPALFFKLMSKTPVEQFREWHFVLGATGSTFLLFASVLLAVRYIAKHTMPEAMIQGFASAYGNIGYMGPGLALMAFGEEAAVPVALIFCFDNAMHFTMAPMIMGLARALVGFRRCVLRLAGAAEDRAASVHSGDLGRGGICAVRASTTRTVCPGWLTFLPTGRRLARCLPWA